MSDKIKINNNDHLKVTNYKNNCTKHSGYKTTDKQRHACPAPHAALPRIHCSAARPRGPRDDICPPPAWTNREMNTHKQEGL